jgi:large subunit ribosomal protein L11
MAKKVVRVIKLQVPAGKATPQPPIGPALGQAGLNIMEFCKAFNAQTQQKEVGSPIPVEITAFSDKTFTFIMKEPTATFLLKKQAGISKGSPRPHTDIVAALKRDDLVSVATKKMKDLNVAKGDIDAAVLILAGSARSMGIKVQL